MVQGGIEIVPAQLGHQLVGDAAGEPRLVWCGNGHASKSGDGEWVPMGWNFREISGVNPFVIDQTVTVEWDGEPQRWGIREDSRVWLDR